MPTLRLRLSRLSHGDRRPKGARLRTKCAAGTAQRAVPTVRFAFQLPYRTRFGQRLSVVGTGVLGEWDPRQAVPMTWSEGDVWKANLRADLLPGDILQYKYVVCNSDGEIEKWKPGDDILLRVPREVEGAEEAQLHILDTWDGAVHEVAVETESDISEECSSGSNVAASGDDFMAAALKRSYEDLEVKLNAAQTLFEATNDPGAMEMVLADRELAIAANKASALAKVVEAAAQAVDLQNRKHQS